MHCRMRDLSPLLRLCLICLLLTSCGGDSEVQDPSISPTAVSLSWKWNSPNPQGNWLSSILWDGSGFVAVGGEGTILQSADGIDWNVVSQDFDMHYNFVSIAYGNGTYVAVGERCTIYRSYDGETWSQSQSGLPEENCGLYKVIWAGSQFVAVGDALPAPPIITSPDGIHWTSRSAPTTATLYDLNWNGSQLVAVGDSGTVLTSSDGVVWTMETSNTTRSFRELAWSGTGYLAVAHEGAVFMSNDGSNWVELANTLPRNTASLIWDGARFIATASHNVYLSNEGSSWTSVSLTSLPAPEEWIFPLDLVWNGSLYVLVGDQGAIMTSEDAQTWTWRSTGNRYPMDALSTVEHNGQYWLAFGYNDKALISMNGTDWESVAVDNDFRVLDMAWAGSQWVAIEYFDGILTSPDGRTWTRSDPDPSFSELNSIIWNGSVLVGVGAGGKILTSPDGNTWSIQTLTGGSNLKSVAWGDGKFVAVGHYGKVFTSTDGVNWQQQQNFTSTYGNDGLVWTGTQFVLVGGWTFATSPDGIQWESHSWPPLSVSPPSSIVMAEDLLVAVGPQAVFTSKDGINWHIDPYSIPTNEIIYDVAYADGLLVVVGDDGVLLSAQYPNPAR